ncbi:MAG: OB-fold nucleic acid binding domain-containing protein [Candidatus Hadarchaeales archaeon]
MREKTLIRLAVVCSVVGVAVLCLAATYAKPKEVELSTVTQELGRMVEVYGTVAEVRFSKGNAFVKLADESGQTVDIPLFSRVLSGLENFEIGDRLRVRGKARTYNGTPQIIPSNSSDVRVYPVPPIRLERLEEFLGRHVKVQGIVREVVQSKGVVILTLENRGRVKVFIPFTPEVLPREGEVVRACGLVQEYRGSLEVVVRCGEGLKLHA